MDNTKTGMLIAERRRALGLTQDELAGKLHVTGKAVSKWERGLSFPGVDLLIPLAESLGVTVMDLLAGEIIAPPQAETAAETVVLDSLTAAERARRRARLTLTFAAMAAVALLIIQLFIGYAPAIFQRGNPLPYLAAAVRLSDSHPYAAVDGAPGVYIARRGDCPALFAMIEEKWDAKLIDQAGSGYMFSNGAATFTVSSEIYWGRFTVWTLPTHTLESPN
ncbi:MAG: helix-turn-helix transcriptional regulator [Clostridia bacterium]|nr:helix-turn-helix transcriptional regulator [Clostridia bacterium]